MGSRDFRKADRAQNRAEGKRDEYATWLRDRNKAKETVNDDTRLALQRVRTYRGTNEFVLSLQRDWQRGAGLWSPTPKQAAIVIRITSDSAREE